MGSLEQSLRDRIAQKVIEGDRKGLDDILDEVNLEGSHERNEAAAEFILEAEAKKKEWEAAEEGVKNEMLEKQVASMDGNPTEKTKEVDQKIEEVKESVKENIEKIEADGDIDHKVNPVLEPEEAKIDNQEDPYKQLRVTFENSENKQKLLEALKTTGIGAINRGYPDLKLALDLKEAGIISAEDFGNGIAVSLNTIFAKNGGDMDRVAEEYMGDYVRGMDKGTLQFLNQDPSIKNLNNTVLEISKKKVESGDPNASLYATYVEKLEEPLKPKEDVLEKSNQEVPDWSDIEKMSREDLLEVIAKHPYGYDSAYRPLLADIIKLNKLSTEDLLVIEKQVAGAGMYNDEMILAPIIMTGKLPQEKVRDIVARGGGGAYMSKIGDFVKTHYSGILSDPEVQKYIR